jgi:hypothetical protein
MRPEYLDWLTPVYATQPATSKAASNGHNGHANHANGNGGHAKARSGGKARAH